MAVLPQYVGPMWFIMITATACGVIVTAIGIYGLVKLFHGEMP